MLQIIQLLKTLILKYIIRKHVISAIDDYISRDMINYGDDYRILYGSKALKNKDDLQIINEYYYYCENVNKPTFNLNTETNEIVLEILAEEIEKRMENG